MLPGADDHLPRLRRRATRLALFAEVYDNSSKQPHKVDIEASAQDRKGGQAVFQTREERDSSELAGGPGGYGFAARVPLKDVAARALRPARAGTHARRRPGRGRSRKRDPGGARRRPDERIRVRRPRVRRGSTGLDSRAGLGLAYSAWWVTGALFLALERSDNQVRFHAAQSMVVFGGRCRC